jgi:hypothetical protein
LTKFAVWLCLLICLDTAFGEAFLVKDGKPQAEIAIAERPARMTRLAVRELQTYIEKITGARLAVTHVPSRDVPVKIYVGKGAWVDELKLSTDGLAYGAFRMASGKDWLALLGPDRDFVPVEPWIRNRSREEIDRVNKQWDQITGDHFGTPFFSLFSKYHAALDVWEYDDAGTLNAVHQFLRDLGVRWYFPGPLGEVVPKQADIRLPAIARVVHPDFALRHLVFWNCEHAPGPSDDEVLWNLRMGIHQGHDLIGLSQPCHGMKFVHTRDEMKQAHPEYYAIWDGKRATDHKEAGAPCLCCEELFEKHLKYARAVFDHYREPMISLDVVDGYGRGICECQRCRDKATPERGRDGSMSDYVWDHINRVAKELYKSHPDRKVSGGSYSTYKLPPEKIDQLSPNLVVSLSQGGRSNLHDPATREQIRQVRRQWLAKLPAGKFYVANGYYVGHPDSRGMPVYFPRLIAQDLRELKDVCLGERIEAYRPKPSERYDYDFLAVNHLNLYVTSRLWWDVNQNLDALLEEYYRLFYGPAAAPMKAFIEYSEKNWMAMNTDAERIGRALELLAAAQAAADPASVYGRRVQRLAAYVRPLGDLRQQLGRRRENVPRYRVHPSLALAGKKLDGRFDDVQYWRELNTPLRDLETGKPPPQGRETVFRVHWAENALYFGIRCGEPDTAHLNLGSTNNGAADIRQSDFVEILLETSTHSYYRITVSPAGKLLEADCRSGVQTKWTSGAQAVTQIGEDYWSVEIRVPVAGAGARVIDPLLGIDGRKPSATYPWHFNVGRQRVRDGVVQRSAYSPTGTNRFEELDKFAEMWSK